MSETTHLMLPFILAAQAQKHVTHNEALRLLDGLVQLAVLDRTRTAPPASPGDGDRHIVASGASGLWAGWDLNVAYFVDGAWMRLVPRKGWLAWVADEEVLLVFDGAAWIEAGGGGGGVSLPELADGSVGALGVNTGADATNRLAVRSNSVLFTAINAGDGGTGDMRYVVNKESPADTASFVFQTAWSGRAEFGLTGSDSFTLKVSPDGSDWTDAFTIDPSGRFLSGVSEPVSLGNTTPSFQLHGPFTGLSALMGARWSDDNNGSGFYLTKSRSDTVGVVGSAVRAGDVLGSLFFAGDDGSQLRPGSVIQGVAEGDWSVSATRNSGFVFRTRHEASQSDRMTLSSAGALRILSIGTTAASANASLNAADGNNLLRSTSSGRYKRDVEPVAKARSDAILALEPVWYRSTAAADRPDWSWYGLIAEDVAKVEPRLVHYGYREDDYDLVPDDDGDGHRRVLKKGATLKPDGVQYDRLVVLLLDVVKRQEARIAALEGRLASAERDQAPGEWSAPV
jgi:hypothetical protein